MYLEIPWDVRNWTLGYTQEAERWLDEVLLASLRVQTVSGMVVVMDPQGFSDPDRKSRFQEMGGLVGAESIDADVDAKKCSVVIQSRVDADDYVAPEFADLVSHMVVHEMEASNGAELKKKYALNPKKDNNVQVKPNKYGYQLNNLLISQPTLPRVYFFPEANHDLRACVLVKTGSDFDYIPSTGLTIAFSREAWFDNKKPKLIRYKHTGLKFSMKPERILFLPPTITMSPVTTLSGHFPWGNTVHWPKCDMEELETYFGRHAAHVLRTVKLPQNGWVDTCKSNKYVKGIQSRSAPGSTDLTCEEMGELFETIRRSDKPNTGFPKLGPDVPKVLDGRVVGARITSENIKNAFGLD